MTDIDPNLHWDGTRWLRWDGTQWRPVETEVPAAAPSGQSFHGYGIDVQWDSSVLQCMGNKATQIALMGKGHKGDLQLPASQLASVDYKPARAMTNGCLTVADIRKQLPASFPQEAHRGLRSG